MKREEKETLVNPYKLSGPKSPNSSTTWSYQSRDWEVEDGGSMATTWNFLSSYQKWRSHPPFSAKAALEALPSLNREIYREFLVLSPSHFSLSFVPAMTTACRRSPCSIWLGDDGYAGLYHKHIFFLVFVLFFFLPISLLICSLVCLSLGFLEFKLDFVFGLFRQLIFFSKSWFLWLNCVGYERMWELS